MYHQCISYSSTVMDGENNFTLNLVKAVVWSPVLSQYHSRQKCSSPWLFFSSLSDYRVFSLSVVYYTCGVYNHHLVD